MYICIKKQQTPHGARMDRMITKYKITVKSTQGQDEDQSLRTFEMSLTAEGLEWYKKAFEGFVSAEEVA